MGRMVFCRDIFEIPATIRKINFEFKYNDTAVYKEEDQLIVESFKKLDSIDGTLEIKRYTRPDLLVIEGILSYFTGELFTIYDLSRGETQIVENNINPSKTINTPVFLLDGDDHSKDLELLLEKLKDKGYKILIITLLDRWRKALYMVSESEVDTFHDEAILTHFHILELLVSYYYKDFKEEAGEEIRRFLEKFSSETLNQIGNTMENTVNSKFPLLRDLLISDEASITTKINYFLKQHSMLDERTYTLVNKIVKIRNSIAHGRMTYKDKLMWPLPPFFNIINSESYMITSQIQVLTARAMALHLGLNIWKDTWELVYSTLPPSDNKLIRFIKNPDEHGEISGTNLLEGNHENITVTSIVDYYIENNSKIAYSEVESVLAKVLKEVPINEKNSLDLFLASVLLCDAEDEELSKIAQNNVELVHRNKWYAYSNIKDIVRYFEFYGIQVKWLYSWIEQEKHLNL